MGQKVASIVAEIGVNSGPLKMGLSSAKTDINNFGKTVNSTFKSIAGFSFAGMGAWKVIDFMGDAIKKSSDLAETVSKVGVVFGAQAPSVLAFGQSTALALGMSENAALTAAGTYGNLFRAMNITESTSAAMSIRLVELAGDLASFNNMDPTMVLDKLRAGLSGEVEPLRSLGVNLNEVIIKQRAMEMGLYSGTGALSASSKAQASYALILEQTSLAQGDFARTSEGLANQQRILKAQWEDLKADAGDVATPVATDFVKLLSDAMDGQKRLMFTTNALSDARSKGVALSAKEEIAIWNTAWAQYALAEANNSATKSIVVEMDYAERMRRSIGSVTDELDNQVGKAYFAGESLEQLADYYMAAGYSADQSASMVHDLVMEIGKVKSKEVTVTTYTQTIAMTGISTSWNDPRRGRTATGTLADFLAQGGGVSDNKPAVTSTKKKKKKGAVGLDFIVPAGFYDDDYNVGVKSGEHVKVTPAGEASSPSVQFYAPVTLVVPNQQSISDFLKETGKM